MADKLQIYYKAALDIFNDVQTLPESAIYVESYTANKLSESVKKLKSLSVHINSNAAKFALLLQSNTSSRSDLPKDAPFVANQILIALTHIHAELIALPSNIGMTLLREYQHSFSSVLSSYLSLIQSVLPTKEQPTSTPISVTVLTPTGQICESSLQWKDISETNEQAVRKVWIQFSNLICDAVVELDEFIKEQEDQTECETKENSNGVMENGENESDEDLMEDEELSVSELQMAKRCIALLKLTKILSKKVQERVLNQFDNKIFTSTENLLNSLTLDQGEGTSGQNQVHSSSPADGDQVLFTQNVWLDELPSYIQQMSELVDNISCHCYPPQDLLAISQEASSLVTVASFVIDLVAPTFDEKSKSHVEWLKKCQDHYKVLLEAILDLVSLK